MLIHNPCVGIFWDELEKIIRIEQRMSLREFCEKAKISAGTLQNLRQRESPDDIQPFTVRRIAAAIGWTVPQFNEWWRSVAEGEPSIESLPDSTELVLSPAALREISDAIKHRRPPSDAAQKEWDRVEAKLKQVRREGKMKR